MNGFKYSKKISNRELFWFSERSGLQNLSYNSFKIGRCYICIDLKLLGLDDKFCNELTLLDMSVDATCLDHYNSGNCLLNFCIMPVYSKFYLDVNKGFNFFNKY